MILEQNGFVRKISKDGYNEGEKGINTSGGCLEKWDQVRGHTNMAKGTIGRIIAEELISKRGLCYIFTWLFCGETE